MPLRNPLFFPVTTVKMIVEIRSSVMRNFTVHRVKYCRESNEELTSGSIASEIFHLQLLKVSNYALHVHKENHERNSNIS